MVIRIDAILGCVTIQVVSEGQLGTHSGQLGMHSVCPLNPNLVYGTQLALELVELIVSCFQVG